MSSVEIGPDLGIEAAADLKAQLLPHLSTPLDIVLDAGSVERVHSASLQLLYAFVRDRSDLGWPTHFHQCAAPLQDAARLLGMSGALGLDRTNTK